MSRLTIVLIAVAAVVVLALIGLATIKTEVPVTTIEQPAENVGGPNAQGQVTAGQNEATAR